METSKVLVTGISGFLGSHTAIQLLEKGYSVVGTLRDLKRSDHVREVISKHTSRTANLTFVEADLRDAAVWKSIVKGVQYVQHIASPFPRVLPKSEDELITPARNGTVAILEAAAESRVKRVVLTSSSGAIVYGRPRDKRSGTFTEKDWTDTTNLDDTTPYFRSKTIAEKTAWEFVQKNKPSFELSVVCPGAILGPVLESDFGTSANIVIKLLDGTTPAVPKIGFDMIDVRSVADLLIRAMKMPQAANQRYIASAGFMTFKEVATVLKEAYPKRKIPSVSLPDFAVRLISMLDQTLKPILIDLSVRRELDHTKAVKELGWEPRSNREAVLSCAKSVLDLNIVK